MSVRKTDAYVRVPKKDAIEMPHQRSCRCNVVESWKTIRRELALDERKCFFASTGERDEPQRFGRSRKEAGVGYVDVFAKSLNSHGAICSNDRDKCYAMLRFDCGRCRGGDSYAELVRIFARRRRGMG